MRNAKKEGEKSRFFIYFLFLFLYFNGDILTVLLPKNPSHITTLTFKFIASQELIRLLKL